MPRVSAARSSACASGTRSSSGQAEAICATGVTETRLFTMGIPYSRSRLSAVSTRRSAVLVTWSYTLVHMRSRFSSAQPMSEMPMVMVRMSRLCSETMPRVSAISCGVMDMATPLRLVRSCLHSVHFNVRARTPSRWSKRKHKKCRAVAQPAMGASWRAAPPRGPYLVPSPAVRYR